MIYSQACAYAIRGLAYVAAVRPEGYVLVADICTAADLPQHFLAKVFQQLVKTGLLVSAKGRGGGFALARGPDHITLFDIVTAIDGREGFETCVVGMATCDDRQPCPQHDQWKPIRERLRRQLEETTLARMAETFESKLAQMKKPLRMPSQPSKPLKRVK